MHCPKLRPLVPGTKRSFTTQANGVRYYTWRDVMSGQWQIQATIQKHSRELAGGPWGSKRSVQRAICEHVKFYQEHFTSRVRSPRIGARAK